MREISPGDIYRHYKGHIYKVLGVARHSEDPNQEFVVYQRVDSHVDNSMPYPHNQLWIRPKGMFLEKIEKDGEHIYRFEKVNATKITKKEVQ